MMRLLPQLFRDRRGATLVITAFAILPLTVATGISIDYARAARLQTKVNSIADASALLAVNNPMMFQSSQTACNRARQMFAGQIRELDGLGIDTGNIEQLDVRVTDNASKTVCASTRSAITTNYARQAVVKWQGTSDNAFGDLIGMAAIPIGGSATAKATVAPDVDFYVLLDTSSSMAIPSTEAGIALMKKKYGCAFACHTDGGWTDKDLKGGGKGDLYAAALSWNLTLKIHDAKKAVADLMGVLAKTSISNNVNYRTSFATFGAKETWARNSFTMQTGAEPTDDFSAVAKKVRSVPTSLYYDINAPVKGKSNHDHDTASTDAMTQMNNNIDQVGKGTRLSGDAPQAVLFVITDGMRNEVKVSANNVPDGPF